MDRNGEKLICLLAELCQDWTWIVAPNHKGEMEKPEFVGRAALEKAKAAGIKRSLVGLEMTERGIARDGYKVLDVNGREIGYVTSGSPAPFLKKNIALAYVPVELAAVGTAVKVEIRGAGVGAVVVPTPFYKRPKKQV